MAHGSQVMTHHDQCSAFGMPGVDVFPEQRLAEFVERGVGFVEQQQGGFGETQPGEQGTLQLTP